MECTSEFRLGYEAYKQRFEEHFSSPLQPKPEWVSLLSPSKFKELVDRREKILSSLVSNDRRAAGKRHFNLVVVEKLLYL